MANERISMRKIRDIIRLREKGLGYRQIGRALRISHPVVPFAETCSVDGNLGVKTTAAVLRRIRRQDVSGASLDQNSQSDAASVTAREQNCPVTCRRTMVCGRNEVGFSVHQAQQLVHGQRQDPEHQVAQHLAVAAHTYLPGAELVLQPTVDRSTVDRSR